MAYRLDLLWAGETRTAMAALRAELRRERYDLVLDLQGLLKSALWGLQAHGPLAGYDHASLREPLAALFYRRRAAVSRQLQAVERNRRRLLGHHRRSAIRWHKAKHRVGVVPRIAGEVDPGHQGLGDAARQDRQRHMRRLLNVGPAHAGHRAGAQRGETKHARGIGGRAAETIELRGHRRARLPDLDACVADNGA